MSGLTELQRKRLDAIAGRLLVDDVPWWNNATDRSLVRRGLIERCDATRRISANVSFTTYLCRLTDKGRALISRTPATGGKP